MFVDTSVSIYKNVFDLLFKRSKDSCFYFTQFHLYDRKYYFFVGTYNLVKVMNTHLLKIVNCIDPFPILTVLPEYWTTIISADVTYLLLTT